MSPFFPHNDQAFFEKRAVEKPTNVNGLILEAWAQGFMVGALIIMSATTVANMRRGVFLHKLILIELLFGIWHGFWIFFNQPIYGWWLSCSAIFLNTSWSLHNVIAWLKNKPFFSRRVSLIYIGSVILVQPYWVLEIYANFAYFHNVNTLFLHTRPFEALCRDPWWIFTTVSLFYNIKTRYELSLHQIVLISPRFAVMLLAMILSIAFIILDICSVTDALKSSLPVGINPFWKLSFVFKCLTDSVILDDFKTALDRLRAFKLSRMGSFGIDDTSDPSGPNLNLSSRSEVRAPNGNPALPSPDGEYINPAPHWDEPKPAPIHLETSRNSYGAHSSRGSDENELRDVDTIDQEPPERTSSDARMLGSQNSRLRDSDVSDGLDYAAALREMSHSTTATNHNHDPEKGIGGKVGKRSR